MPGFDRTGPMGAGPKTGRGMGHCGTTAIPGLGWMGRLGWGRGFGLGRGLRGRGLGFGRRSGNRYFRQGR